MKKGFIRHCVGFLAFATSMLAFDLLWLGVVARSLYVQSMGSLMRDPVYAPAALLFYVMYAFSVYWLVVRVASSVRDVAVRGAQLGAFAYATYDLTNWAVIAGWPASIVLPDILWGIVLTATASAFAYTFQRRFC